MKLLSNISTQSSTTSFCTAVVFSIFHLQFSVHVTVVSDWQREIVNLETSKPFSFVSCSIITFVNFFFWIHIWLQNKIFTCVCNICVTWLSYSHYYAKNHNTQVRDNLFTDTINHIAFLHDLLYVLHFKL